MSGLRGVHAGDRARETRRGCVVRWARERDGAQAIEAAAGARADAMRESVEIAEHVEQKAEALERIASIEMLAQARAENGAELHVWRGATREPCPRVEAIGVAVCAAADGMKLHGAHDEDRGYGSREAIETTPTLIYVAVVRARCGEKKLHRPDEQQHRPSDEALEAMLAD